MLALGFLFDLFGFPFSRNRLLWRRLGFDNAYVFRRLQGWLLVRLVLVSLRHAVQVSEWVNHFHAEPLRRRQLLSPAKQYGNFLPGGTRVSS